MHVGFPVLRIKRTAIVWLPALFHVHLAPLHPRLNALSEHVAVPAVLQD